MFTKSLRKRMINELDEYLDGFGSVPAVEPLTQYFIQLLEQAADDEGIDDVAGELEDLGALDGCLQESLESEIQSADEPSDGEDLIRILEGMCEIEWVDGDGEPVTEEEDFE
jgi:hypothetical protein